MKKKIVIKVKGKCKKCWSKAMKIVAVAEGEIFSVAWEGECKEKMVVIGCGVYVDTLIRKLKKKLCCAELLLVEEVKKEPVVDKTKVIKETIEKTIKETIKQEKIKEVIKETITQVIPERTSQCCDCCRPACCRPYCSCKQQYCYQPSYPFGYPLCVPVVVYEDPCTSACNIM